MIYLLIDEKRKQNAIDHIKKLPESDKWEVVIQEYKKKRSLAQNRLYWMYLPYLADHFGYSKDDMHDELKYHFIGEEHYIGRKGVARIRPKSTTKLNVKQMVEYLTKIELLAQDNDIKLPIPDDYKFCLMRE